MNIELYYKILFSTLFLCRVDLHLYQFQNALRNYFVNPGTDYSCNAQSVL